MWEAIMAERLLVMTKSAQNAVGQLVGLSRLGTCVIQSFQKAFAVLAGATTQVTLILILQFRCESR